MGDQNVCIGIEILQSLLSYMWNILESNANPRSSSMLFPMILPSFSTTDASFNIGFQQYLICNSKKSKILYVGLGLREDEDTELHFSPQLQNS